MRINEKIINNCVKSNQLLLCPILEKKGMLTLSTKGDHKNLKAYANPAQLKRVTVLLSIPALVNHTDKVEKTKSIGNPDEKPSIIIFNGFSVKKNKKFLFNYFLQKDGKKIISIANISSLPKIIPIDSNHLD